MARARRLLADRDDPRLLTDLERLAEGNDAAPALPLQTSQRDGRAREPGRPSRFRRDNASDPLVMADLERLAGGTATALGVPSGRRRQPALVRHVRRYLGYYVLALGAVLVVSLRPPVGSPVAGDASALDSPATPGLARPLVPANPGVEVATGPSLAGVPPPLPPTAAVAAPSVAPSDQPTPILDFPAEPAPPASVRFGHPNP